MSKIGKKPIPIPAGVEVKIDGRLLTVKGPKGELKRTFSGNVAFEVKDTMLIVAASDSALWGLSRALAANLTKGVTEGFQEVLEFSGVGYKAQVKDGGLELGLGFSKPVTIAAVPGVAFKVEKNTIIIQGADKEAVGQVAAKIRATRPPEPYKGHGIKYRDEIVKRKAGKKAATATA